MVARNTNPPRRINNDNHNHHPRPRLNVWGLMLVPYVVFVLIVVHIIVIDLVYHGGRVDINDINIDNIHVNYTFLNITTVALSGNTTLEVFFKTSGNVERFFGDFKISSTVFRNDPINSFSQYTGTSSEGEKDVVVVRYNSHPTTLPPEKLQLISESLAKGKFWLRLSVEYAWNVKQEVYSIITPPMKYVRFCCQIPYKAVHADKYHPTRCIKL